MCNDGLTVSSGGLYISGGVSIADSGLIVSGGATLNGGKSFYTLDSCYLSYESVVRFHDFIRMHLCASNKVFIS